MFGFTVVGNISGKYVDIGCFLISLCFFTLFKNQTDNLLRDIKKGVKEEGTKKAKETALSQLPTPEKLENEDFGTTEGPYRAMTT